jgi:hypothetical protein
MKRTSEKTVQRMNEKSEEENTWRRVRFLLHSLSIVRKPFLRNIHVQHRAQAVRKGGKWLHALTERGHIAIRIQQKGVTGARVHTNLTRTEYS